MLLKDKEEEFIGALFPFIESPRLAKRFVNIYRLLRVAAATRNSSFSQFTHSEEGDYRAVLLLLAITVGEADVASDLLNALHNSGNGSFRTWLTDKARHYEEEWAKLNRIRIARETSSGASIPPSGRETRLFTLHGATDRIEAKFGNLRKLKSASFDDRLEVYGRWAREVGRYSFHWHLKARDYSDRRLDVSTGRFLP